MQRPQSLLPRNALIAAAITGGLLANSGLARGQAIVTYGVNAGRAAGAGAAAGTGAAGIFDKLNKTTSKAARHEAKGKQHPKPSPESARKPASPNAITIGGASSASGFGESGTVRTSGGISIAGLAAPKPANAEGINTSAEISNAPDSAGSVQAANPRSEPEGFRLPEVTLPDPAPSVAVQTYRREAAATLSGAPTHTQNSPVTPGAGPAKPVRPMPKTPALVIAEGIAPKDASTPGAPATPLTIQAGMPIQDVIELLGQPLMRLSGVEGAGYDERYVFLTANGPKLTVFTKDGLVLKVTAE